MFSNDKKLFGCDINDKTIKSYVYPDNFKNMDSSHKAQIKSFIEEIKKSIDKW